MSADILQRLFQNLQACRHVYARLLEVAERKRAHLVRNDAVALRQDLADEERLAGMGAELAAEREQLHTRCAAFLRVRPAARTLGDLTRAMPQGWQTRFDAERRELRRTVERLQDVNKVNVILVNNSLEMMQGLLAAMFDAEPATGYARNGMRPQPRFLRHTLDARA
jgi:flagellar biosynthesis/type III secretory pathway chaperone